MEKCFFPSVDIAVVMLTSLCFMISARSWALFIGGGFLFLIQSFNLYCVCLTHVAIDNFNGYWHVFLVHDTDFTR